MTDQRYTGPDGAKRLEMLEELAAAVVVYLAQGWNRGVLVRCSTDINRDNRRVDRLAEEHQAFQAKQGTRPRRLFNLPDE